MDRSPGALALPTDGNPLQLLPGTDVGIKIEEFMSIPIDTFNTDHSDSGISGFPKLHSEEQGCDIAKIENEGMSSSSDKAKSGLRKVIRCVSKEPTASEDPSNVMANTVMKYLGIPGDKGFTRLSENDKEEVGCRLEALLSEVTESTLIPLINSSLSREEVEKLASLKGITVNTIDRDNINDESVKKEEASENSDFENIPNQSSKTHEAEDQENNSDSDSSTIISSDEEDFIEAEETEDAKACPEAIPSGCAVCGDSIQVPPSSGQSACHTCVSFFEMGFRGRCRKGGDCKVTKETRAKCTACRYDKCMSVGMIPGNRKRKANEPLIEGVPAPKLCVVAENVSDIEAEAEKVINPMLSEEDKKIAFRHRLLNILEEDVKALSISHAFATRVSKSVFPEYYDIVKEPICIEDIHTAVMNDEYKDKNDFLSDFQKMYKNSVAYKGKDDELSMGALTIFNSVKASLDYWQQVRLVKSMIGKQNFRFLVFFGRRKYRVGHFRLLAV